MAGRVSWLQDACTVSRIDNKVQPHAHRPAHSFKPFFSHLMGHLLHSREHWTYSDTRSDRLNLLKPFLPARCYAIAGNSYRNVYLSVCPSVRLSVCLSRLTSRCCAKTKKDNVMISSLPGSPMILVFWRQILSQNSKGFPANGGLEEGWGVKIQRFSSFKRQYLENGNRYGQSYY